MTGRLSLSQGRTRVFNRSSEGEIVGRSGVGTPTKFVWWREGDWWLSYLKDYPDHWTQGESPEDLEDHLESLLEDIAGGVLSQ